MSQEIEIEAKSMLTYESFHELLHFFKLQNKQADRQHNHYIETNSFSLKEKGAGLRVREKEGSYTFTLKQRHHIGKLETHQPITENEWLQIKEDYIIPDGHVKKQLLSLHIPLQELRYVGTLTTERIEFDYNDGILCLDQSRYFDQVDYEIEFEGKSEEHANSTLADLLHKRKIEPIPSENKVRRFFKQKELNEHR